MSDVTQILERVERGDGKAAEELLPLVYEELRKLAESPVFYAGHVTVSAQAQTPSINRGFNFPAD